MQVETLPGSEGRERDGARHQARPTLVLLHGALSSSSGWDDVARRLSGRWRVIAPDLPGHGASSRPERFSFEEAARSVEASMDEAGGDAFVLCGCSLGGAAAQLVASRDELGRVKGVFVADAAPLDALAYDRLTAFSVDRSTSALRVSATRSIRSVSRALARDLAATKEGRALAQRVLSEETLEGLLWMNRAANETLLRFVRHADSAFEVGVPLFLAVGTRDRAVGVRAQMRAWAKRTGVRLEAVSGAGHLSYLDAPARFAELLEAFADGLCSPSGRSGRF